MRRSAVVMVWRETVALATVAASLCSYYCVTVGAAHLALAYFVFDYVDGVTCVYHLGYVFSFAFDMVELEHAVVRGAAVGAFSVDAFVAFYECFVAVALISVLFDSYLW